MKRLSLKIALACASVVVVFSACHRPWFQMHFPAQQFVDSFVALQPDGDTQQLDAFLGGGELTTRFDVNQYFTVLNALRLENGFVLDWVYFQEYISGGFPVLYIRETETPPFVNFESYISQAKNASSNKYSPPFYNSKKTFFNYIEIIHVEDSPTGFFQLVVLRVLGDRFNLFWHELYNETMLVCSKKGWEAVLKEQKQRGAPYAPPPPEFVATAEKMDFLPVIRMGKELVEVDVTTYNPFHGLDLHHFVIARQFPHRILQHTQTNILRHTQNFMF